VRRVATMNRRDFVRTAGAFAVPALLAPASLTKVAGFKSELSPIAAVVFDQRYSDARKFSDALMHQGAAGFATDGDAVSVWYSTLRDYLAQKGGRAAGLTTFSDFAIMRVCAAELKLNFLYQGFHDGRMGDMRHVIFTLRGDSMTAQILHSGTDWPRVLADMLTRGADKGMPEAPVSIASSKGKTADHPGFLVSWVIGPAANMRRA
jgi:hypothetical protein